MLAINKWFSYVYTYKPVIKTCHETDAFDSINFAVAISFKSTY